MLWQLNWIWHLRSYSNFHLSMEELELLSCDLTGIYGYSRHEVLGRNCRFLNGPDTDMEALQEIKSRIQAEQACSVRLLNYRKDESSFWNLLHIAPVRNATGKIAFYVGVQINENCKDVHGLSSEMRQLSAVAAVKVAVRSLFSGAGTSASSSSS